MTQARITQAGVYVETSGDDARITQAGVYVETSEPGLRITQAGVYVETQIPPAALTSGWVVYDNVDISAYVHSIRLEAAIDQWDARSFASTGGEWGSGLAKWRLPLKGHWAPEWDGTVMPDVVTPPDTPKDVRVYFLHRPTNTYVQYEWLAGGVIKQANVGGRYDDAIGWELELVLAGAPTRTVV